MTTNLLEKQDLPKTFQEAKDAGLPVFKFFTDGPAKAVNLDDNGGDAPSILLTASTTVTDLAGDNITPQCLNQMQEAAVGTTIFLNHSFDVPQDVFGVVVQAFIKERTDEKTGETYQCLDYVVEVEMSNPAAAKTYEIIKNGKVKLGASITILILESETLADGTYSILSVKYLETSIVGLPMNQNSWVRQAVKALKWLERNQGNSHIQSRQKPNVKQNRVNKTQNHDSKLKQTKSGHRPVAAASTKGNPKMKKPELVHKNAFDEVLANGATATCQDLCEALCGAIDNLLEQADAKNLDDPMGALKELISDFEDALIAHVKPALDSMDEEDESDEEDEDSDGVADDEEDGSDGTGGDDEESYSITRAREFFKWKAVRNLKGKGKISRKSEADDLVDDDDDSDNGGDTGPWQEIHDMCISRGATCMGVDDDNSDYDSGADNDDSGKSASFDPKKLKNPKVKGFVLHLQKENKELADAAEAATRLLEYYAKQPLD